MMTAVSVLHGQYEKRSVISVYMKSGRGFFSIIFYDNNNWSSHHVEFTLKTVFFLSYN